MKWDLSVLSDCALQAISTPSSLPPIHLFNYPHDSNLIFVCFTIPLPRRWFVPDVSFSSD